MYAPGSSFASAQRQPKYFTPNGVASALSDSVRVASEPSPVYCTDLSRRLRDGVSLFSLIFFPPKANYSGRILCPAPSLHPPCHSFPTTKTPALLQLANSLSSSRSPDESNVFFSGPTSQVLSGKCGSHHGRK